MLDTSDYLGKGCKDSKKLEKNVRHNLRKKNVNRSKKCHRNEINMKIPWTFRPQTILNFSSDGVSYLSSKKTKSLPTSSTSSPTKESYNKNLSFPNVCWYRSGSSSRSSRSVGFVGMSRSLRLWMDFVKLTLSGSLARTAEGTLCSSFRTIFLSFWVLNGCHFNFLHFFAASTSS